MRSPWYVLIEVDLDSAEGPSAHERLETARAAAFTKGLIQDAAIAANEAEAEQFWRLGETLSEAERSLGPTLHFEITVTVARMQNFMVDRKEGVEGQEIAGR